MDNQMTKGRKLLIAYLVMQLLSVGCSTSQNHRQPDFRAAAESFKRAGEALRYFEDTPQVQERRVSTRCYEDYVGGYVCN